MIAPADDPTFDLAKQGAANARAAANALRDPIHDAGAQFLQGHTSGQADGLDAIAERMEALGEHAKTRAAAKKALEEEDPSDDEISDAKKEVRKCSELLAAGKGTSEELQTAVDRYRSLVDKRTRARSRYANSVAMSAEGVDDEADLIDTLLSDEPVNDGAATQQPSAQTAPPTNLQQPVIPQTPAPQPPQGAVEGEGPIDLSSLLWDQDGLADPTGIDRTLMNPDTDSGFDPDWTGVQTSADPNAQTNAATLTGLRPENGEWRPRGEMGGQSNAVDSSPRPASAPPMVPPGSMGAGRGGGSGSEKKPKIIDEDPSVYAKDETTLSDRHRPAEHR